LHFRQRHKQIVSKLGVTRTTLGKWRQTGRVRARICNDRGEWLYRLADELAAIRRSACVAANSRSAATSTRLGSSMARRIPTKGKFHPTTTAIDGD
jgi:predicted site-specific integrase-resolvase